MGADNLLTKPTEIIAGNLPSWQVANMAKCAVYACILVAFYVAVVSLSVNFAAGFRKEISVEQNDLIDTNGNVIASRMHEAPVVDPRNVDWISHFSEQGDIFRSRVRTVIQTPCSDASDTCVYGFQTTYRTDQGYFMAAKTRGALMFKTVSPPESTANRPMERVLCSGP